ncbi:hypothetical protein RF55_14049 [Lasius niger]|uniref:Endonuclease/exonuclease/phosphatase domain-containing protein n=1 Tax=Lasius niger TaxID=67767 RepID=A0A0J7K8U8_LASNI|nr:hypothetical protein RF55_14049 [Lasius niger]
MECWRVVRLEGERWRLVGVYVRGDMAEKLQIMREWMEENGSRVKTMIGGDFNARTGKLGGRVREEGDVEEEGRTSMDKKVNGDRKLLIGRLEEVGWEIMNGGVTGDEKGNWTYTGGKGQTVIDYVIGNGELRGALGNWRLGIVLSRIINP